MPIKMNLVGPHGQLYADPKPSPDEDAFQVDNTSEAYYNSPYYLLHKNQVQPIPPRRTGALPYINLTDYIPKTWPTPLMLRGKLYFTPWATQGRRNPVRISPGLPRLPSKPPSPTR
jgi:hypothetical protein